MLNDHHLEMWFNRNSAVLGKEVVLQAISLVTQQQMARRTFNLDEQILCDGQPYPETLEKINKYYLPENLDAFQRKLWLVYEERLFKMQPKRVNNRTEVSHAFAEAEQALKDARQAYEVLCFGKLQDRVLFDDPQLDRYVDPH